MTPQALSDIRVLDLSRILAGPYATMLLADMGAEVIKVEQPDVGDGTRHWGPPWVGPFSAYFLSVNRNKRSITVNLKTDEGREIIKSLAAKSDILVENFKVGAMKRLGLDYETLSKLNPSLIYCSITGYGQNGPYKDRPGYDFMIQAHGGIMSITGPEDGPPYKVGVAVVDVTAGLFAANAILAALHHRQRTGQGQYIDVALLDSQVAWLVNVAQNYRPGYDFMIQAHGGIMSITGPEDGPPYKVGVAVVDVTAGLFAANAILAALHHRQRTGQGQYIDVALLDSQVAWLVNVAQNYFATGQPPKRYGNAHPNIVPYETFETADGFLALAVGADNQFMRLCHVIGRPDLWEDERFQTNAGRVTHRHALIPELQRVFRSRPTDAWMQDLIEAKIPASPINDIPTVFADPQVRHRRMVQTIHHPDAGEIILLGPVPKFSLTPAEIRTPPPLLGVDTDEVLKRLLGMDDKTLTELRTNGII